MHAQILEHGSIAIERIGRIARVTQRLEAHRARIQHQQTADQALAKADDLAGAGLDVFEHEPAVNPKLVKLARAGKVVILPHMGSATLEGRVDMGEKVIINIRTFMDGHRPPDRVLPSML